jgi:hypothetical protein
VSTGYITHRRSEPKAAIAQKLSDERPSNKQSVRVVRRAGACGCAPLAFRAHVRIYCRALRGPQRCLFLLLTLKGALSAQRGFRI